MFVALEGLVKAGSCTAAATATTMCAAWLTVDRSVAMKYVYLLSLQVQIVQHVNELCCELSADAVFVLTVTLLLLLLLLLLLCTLQQHRGCSQGHGLCRKRHALQVYRAPHGRHRCDVCCKLISQFTSIGRCHACDYDMCSDCM
jgi:hypothetical protein